MSAHAKRPVWGRGPAKPLFMIVGEGPGREEDATGVPFHPDAPAGKLLTGILTELGVKRSEVYITNATRCYKPWDVKIKPEHVKACKSYLTQEIEIVDPGYIVLAGNPALKAVFGHEGISKEHGLLKDGPDGRKYFPVLHPASALPNRYPENRDKIRDALRNLLSIIRSDGKNTTLDGIRYNLVDTREKMLKLRARLRALPAGTPTVFDYETNTLLTPFHGADVAISGVAFCWDENEAWYLVIDHRNPPNLLSSEDRELAVSILKEFARSDLLKIAHNLKFEYNQTHGNFGVRLKPPFACTVLLSHLIDSTRGIHGLDAIAWKVGMGGYDMELEQWFARNGIKHEDRDYTKVDLDVLSRYSMLDGVAARRWWSKGYEIIEERGQVDLFLNHVCACVRAYADMEARGALVDLDYLDRLSQYYDNKTKNVIEVDLRRIATQAGFELLPEFKLSSPDQVGDLLTRWLGADQWPERGNREQQNTRMVEYDEDMEDFRNQISFTEKGRLSTAKVVLQTILAIKPLTPEQREFLEKFVTYRAAYKRFTTSVEGLRKHICPDGRVRTSYFLEGTETGRRSSSKPNMQNIPRDPMIKRVFVAAKDHLLIMNDYKNLEVRIAAALSGDEKLVRAFLDGKDIHTFTASLAYQYDYDDMVRVLGMSRPDVQSAGLVDKYLKYDKARKLAKVVMWVILFGGGAEKIALTAGIPLADATRLRGRMMSEFPRLDAMFKRLERLAVKRGYAENAFGRRRYLAGLNSDSRGIVNEALRQALNSPVQGSAADITSRAITKLNKILAQRSLRAGMELEVHDDLTGEVHYEDVYSVITIGRKVMESVKVECCPEMIFEVDQKIGSHLGSGRKVDDKVIQLAKEKPRRLYQICRADLQLGPEDYEGVA